jgi:hypothetical protein
MDKFIFLSLTLNSCGTHVATVCISIYLMFSKLDKKVKKSEAIPVTGHGGLYGCEMLRIPHCQDNWLTDGGEVVSPMHPPHSTPQKHYFYVSGTHFC